MAGGSARDVARARLLLECFSKEVIHAGPLCSGMRLKLLKNHLSYLALGIAHEARRLAEVAGIEAGVLRHVVAETRLLEQFFHFGLERDRSERLAPDADAEALGHARKFTEMAHKDLDAALALARDHDLALPFGETARAQAGRYFLLPRDRDPDGAE
jgi:3-hydroxyisobutyrate dehydrogenase-like beta-hydroxyacid dehydrogenase